MVAGSRFYSHSVALQLLRFTEIPQEESCNHIQNAVTLQCGYLSERFGKPRKDRLWPSLSCLFQEGFNRSGGTC